MRASLEFAPLIELLIEGYAVNGRPGFPFAYTVRDSVTLSADLRGRALECERVAEALEKRVDPGFARYGYGADARRFAAKLEAFPVDSGGRKRRLDFGAGAPRFEAEVLWLLTGDGFVA